MKKTISVMFSAVAVCVVSAGALFAVDYTTITNATQASLDIMAKDIGAVMGAGQYHNAKNLGFPGFDVGVRIPVKNLTDGNNLKTSEISIISLPAVQIEIGLPGNIDIMARGLTYESVSYMGYGLKYGIFSQNFGVADLAISAMVNYGSMKNDYIQTTNFGYNACISLGLPVITPYVSVGSDSSELTPGVSAIAANPLLSGHKGTASGLRYEGGINLKPFPLFYIYYGYTVMYGDAGQTVGLGIKF
jgi:hypothetical protein